MFSAHRTGLGQDRELKNLRRRFQFGILLLVAGAIIALVISAVLLWERRGTILVTADRPEAVVVINGSVTATKVGTPIKRLRPDKYSVSVFLDGYVPEPPEQIVNIEPGHKAEIEFKLVVAPPEPEPEPPRQTEEEDFTPYKRPSSSEVESPSDRKTETGRSGMTESAGSDQKAAFGTLKIETLPVAGGIFVDDEFKGSGKITLTEVPLGEIVVRFGEVEGYRTPETQKAFLTPSWPLASVKATYLPLIYISAWIDQSGRSITKKCTVKQGYILGDQIHYNEPVAGPGIKFLENVNLFSWEIGYAFSNRNPPGQDFVELEFTLPENWDGNKPLELHLYGYASDRKFPFAMGGKTAVDIFVNDRRVKAEFPPGHMLAGDQSPQADIIPVNSFLQAGVNKIRVQASEESRCFYYLQQIVLL